MGSHSFRIRTIGAACGLAAIGSTAAFGQCGSKWYPAAGIPGVNGTVYASAMWDPDGPGPTKERLVVGGTFTIAGEVPASNIAEWDGINWLPLGAGIAGPNVVPSVRSLAVASDGSLVAGGTFEFAGESAANNIAKWDGAQWSSLGAGTSGSVFALTCEPGGGIIAGGSFLNAGATPANRIARWDGAAWTALGDGVNSIVNALGRLSSGEIVAGGMFTSAGNVAVSRIAVWNGTSWSALGTGFTNGITGSPSIASIAIGPSDRIIAAGNFVWSANGRTMSGLAQWTGTEWIDVGNKPAGAVSCVVVLPNGDIVRTGGYRFDGSVWTLLANGPIPGDRTIAVASNDEFYFGGTFEQANGVTASRVACIRGGKMRSVGTGWTGKALASAVDARGRLLIGGEIAPANSPARIYRWDGASWEQLGAGFPLNRKVVAIAPGPLDSVYAAFDRIPSIVRIDGDNWQEIGRPVGGRVNALLMLPGGDLVAAGSFWAINNVQANSISRWDGSQWKPMGDGLGGTVSALALLPNGEIVAGGHDFVLPNNSFHRNIARWNGQAWVAFDVSPTSGGRCRSIDALTVLRSGELVGAGWWSTMDRDYYYASIARWNESAWIAYGPSYLQVVDGRIRSLAQTQDQTLVAGGSVRVQPTLDPSTWDLVCRLPTIIQEPRFYNNSGVTSLSLLPDGQLAAVGDFGDVDRSIASPGISIWTDSGRPWVATKQRSRTIDAGNVLEIAATPARRYHGVRYLWLRNGVAVQNGSAGASAGGGFVSGASGNAESPTNGYPCTLIIENAQVSDTGYYEIVLENDCGADSFSATQIVRGCASDLSGDGIVDDDDFKAFMLAYDLLHCSDPQMPLDCPADLTGDGAVDDADFVSFGQAYHMTSCP